MNFSNVEPMNYRQIEIFSAVMEHASVTEAARHLGLSQPAVSKSLAALEDQLGLRLFNRTTRGLHATDEARELHAEARRVLEGFEQLGIFARNLHRLEHARLVVGVMPALSTSWLARVVTRFSEAYPDVSVVLRALGSASIVKRVAQGELDVGVGQVRAEDPSVVKRKLSDLQLVCVVPREHPLAGNKVIVPSDLENEPIVLLSIDDEFRRMLDGKLLSRGINIQSRIEATQSNMICFLVEEGRRIGIVDSETASLGKWPSTVTIPFKPVIKTPIYIVHNSRSPQNLAAKRFCEHIMKLRPRQLVE
jgi:DNA-binding transcriptional LysR family regulator